jgi:hypothetical protein
MKLIYYLYLVALKLTIVKKLLIKIQLFTYFIGHLAMLKMIKKSNIFLNKKVISFIPLFCYYRKGWILRFKRLN